jgi:hypothetical protein
MAFRGNEDSKTEENKKSPVSEENEKDDIIVFKI